MCSFYALAICKGFLYLSSIFKTSEFIDVIANMEESMVQETKFDSEGTFDAATDLRSADLFGN